MKVWTAGPGPGTVGYTIVKSLDNQREDAKSKSSPDE